MAAYDNVSLQGPPQAPSYAAPLIGIALGQQLSELPDSYFKGTQMGRTRALQTAFQEGMPRLANGQVDYAKAQDTLARLGGAEYAQPIAQLGMQQAIGRDAADAILGNDRGGGDRGPDTNPAGPSNVTPRPPQQPPQSQPMNGYTGGDNGQNTIMAAVIAAGIPEDKAGLMANNISGALQHDPNQPASPDIYQKAYSIAKRSAASLGPRPVALGPPDQNGQTAAQPPGANAVSGAPAPGSTAPITPTPVPTQAFTQGQGGAPQPSQQPVPPQPQAQPQPPGNGLPSAIGSAGIPYNQYPAAIQRIDNRIVQLRAAGAANAAVNPAVAAQYAHAAEDLTQRRKQMAEELQKVIEPTTTEKDARASGMTPLDYEGRKKFGEKFGEKEGEAISEYITAGRAAYKRMEMLDVMQNALQAGQGKMTTGPFAEAALKMKQLANSAFGWDLEGLQPAEVVQKMGFSLATQTVKEISNRPTQLEVKQALANNPGLLLSEKGSAFMISILKQTARQDADISRLLLDRRNHADWLGVVDRYYQQHPVISPFTGKPIGGDDVKILGAGAQPQPGAQPQQPGRSAGPQPGAVVDGYRFNGGNPNDPKSWAKVQ